MPTYVYECSTEKNGCGNQYEITMSVTQYDSYQPKCPHCKKKKSVARFYTVDGVYIRQESQTLGSIAEKNTSRLSNDEKNHLRKEHTKYKDEPLGPLPEGASYYAVDSSTGKRIPSTEQRDVDPRRAQAKAIPKKPKRKANVKKRN